MINSIIQHIFQCNEQLEKNSSIVLLATFLISYLVFNLMFKTNKEEVADRRQKQQIAEIYLKQHEKEDRAFFTGETEEN